MIYSDNVSWMSIGYWIWALNKKDFTIFISFSNKSTQSVFRLPVHEILIFCNNNSSDTDSNLQRDNHVLQSAHLPNLLATDHRTRNCRNSQLVTEKKQPLLLIRTMILLRRRLVRILWSKLHDMLNPSLWDRHGSCNIHFHLIEIKYLSFM